MPSSQDIVSPQPLRPLKRSASHLSNLDEQPSRPAPSGDTPPLSPTTTARLFDWALNLPVAFDRKGSRSDSFLLELERGNNKIEARRQLLENTVPQYPESETTTSTREDPMASKKTEQAYRTENLLLHEIVFDPEDGVPPHDLSAFLEKTIIGPRNYTPMTLDEFKSKIVPKAAAASAGSEADLILEYLNCPLFPSKEDCTDKIKRSANRNWNKVPFPVVPNTEDTVKTPRPDVFFGFDLSKGSLGTARLRTASSKRLKPWTKPTVSAILTPFLMLEAKALTGSTGMMGAENQGAGSGTHSVSTTKELHSLAGEEHTVSDTVAFIITMDAYSIHLWAHYWDSSDEQYHMYRVAQYITKYHESVERFRAHWANILTWARDIRLPKILRLLDLIVEKGVDLDVQSQGAQNQGAQSQVSAIARIRKICLTQVKQSEASQASQASDA
ncbi:hypothetical protein MMC10_009788 [Thelotrema lepadinum]|nr:hypothetical protein [Thelotrema lepadinum]